MMYDYLGSVTKQERWGLALETGVGALIYLKTGLRELPGRLSVIGMALVMRSHTMASILEPYIVYGHRSEIHSLICV